jgi:hypothetical protein
VKISLVRLVCFLAAFIGLFVTLGAVAGTSVAVVTYLALNALVSPLNKRALGVECNSLDDVNNFFNLAKNQFTTPIYNWVWIQNPWISLFPRSMWDYQDGLTPEVVTSTGEMPTDYPDNLPGITLSDGTGNTACVTDPRTILDGVINRNYTLELDSWKTRTFCLTDLQFSWQAERMAENLQANMRQYTTARWADWYRVKNICMIDTKVSTGSGCTLDQDENADCDFAAVDLPTAELDWCHLNCLYDSQTFLGAEPVGYSEGNPLYALSVGPGYKRKLWQTDNQVRDTVNWGDAFQNFQARGINTSINGLIPNIDPYPIRYEADAVTKIYPWRNVAATRGRKFEKNPEYMTVARGGSAVYETFTILPRNAYEVKVRPSGPTSFGGMTFDPTNYVGEPLWINNRDMCANLVGNMGFYMMQLAMAAKAIRPEVGITGLTLAKDC